MLVGPDHRVLLPATLSIGATYLLFIDGVARTAVATEIPLGILTAMIGRAILCIPATQDPRSWQ